MMLRDDCKKHSLKISILASIGSGLEYYDFVVYGLMAQYLADIFFSSQNGLSALIQTFSIFSIGYFVRPIGGTIVGMVSDVFGRKKVFVIVMLMMAFSTLLIGLLPTYECIGIWASLLLTLCRILQGLSFGAEFPGAVTIVSEFSSKNRLGKLCSFIFSSTSLGTLLATFMLSILNMKFSYNEIIGGAWRIPFIFGGILAFVSCYIRSNITETPEFQNNSRMNTNDITVPVKLLFSQNLFGVYISFCLTLFLAILVITNLYVPVYINKYFKYHLSQIYTAMSISMLASFVFVITFGLISDCIPKIKILALSVIVFGLALFFMYNLLYSGSYIALQTTLVIYQLCIAIYCISYLPIISRLFTTNTRYTGIALTYNVAFSIASTIPFFISYFFSEEQNPIFLGKIFLIAIIIAFIPISILLIRCKTDYVY